MEEYKGAPQKGQCPICGGVGYVRFLVIPKDKTTETASSWTEGGVCYYTCEDCGSVFQGEFEKGCPAIARDCGKISVEGYEFQTGLHVEYSHDELIQMYWNAHPRYRFLKFAPASARFLDIGAGNGGLGHWKKWGSPIREDLRMYGIDLKVGEFATLYENFEALNLDENKLPYDSGFFDAVISTHVFEHLRHPKEVADQILRTLKPGGECYLETPNLNSLNTPSRKIMEESGFVGFTANFYDDPTHLKPFNCSALLSLFGDRVVFWRWELFTTHILRIF